MRLCLEYSPFFREAWSIGSSGWPLASQGSILLTTNDKEIDEVLGSCAIMASRNILQYPVSERFLIGVPAHGATSDDKHDRRS